MINHHSGELDGLPSGLENEPMRRLNSHAEEQIGGGMQESGKDLVQAKLQELN